MDLVVNKLKCIEFLKEVNKNDEYIWKAKKKTDKYMTDKYTAEDFIILKEKLTIEREHCWGTERKIIINNVAVVIKNDEDFSKLDIDFEYEMESGSPIKEEVILYIPTRKILIYCDKKELLNCQSLADKDEIDWFIESESEEKGKRKIYEDYRKSKNYIEERFK